MKKILLLIIASLGLITASFAGSPLIAFPGAEGFGKYAVGGRGGKVVAVTNLQDYKATETPIQGSLRWALNEYVRTDSVYRKYIAANGGDSLVKKAITVFTPLTIVFKVSGTIWLKEDLKVKRDSLTIAGQTAPGDGICIAGRSVLFNGATGGDLFYYGPRRKELIVRHLRFRPGYPRNDDGTPLLSATVVTYGTDVENYENVIFDHCTMSWANEECLAIYDNKNTTVQWSIVSEGLYCAYHKKGLRSYGGVWGGQYASYHNNLIAHQSSRAIRFGGARAHDTIAVIDYSNNVVYNWGNNDAIYGGEIEIPSGRSEINMQNNYYKKGPILATASATPSITNKGHRLVYLYDAASPANGHGEHYVNGNYVYGYPTVTANNWLYGVQFKYYSDTTTTYPAFRLNTPSPEVTSNIIGNSKSAETAFPDVLANAGATLPLRDAHDKRVANEVLTGTATGYGSIATYINNGSTFSNSTYLNKVQGIIDDPAVVGGWPTFSTGTVAADSDGDGMPDDYETAQSLNPNDSIDGNGIDASGYTNLEVYLNSIGTFQNFLQAPFNLKASLNGANKPQLSWQDVSEIEENYVIERSTDSIAFAPIDTIAANSASYTDINANGVKYFYRVRAITATLQSAYTNIVGITVPTTAINETKIEGLKVYPNPVSSVINIEANEDIVGLEIISVGGLSIERREPNSKTMNIAVDNLPQGIYTLKISARSGKQEIVKVLK